MLKTILQELQNNLGGEESPASERQVAKFLGVSHEAINSWLNGDYGPRLETVNDLIAANTHALNALYKIKAFITPELPKLVEVEGVVDKSVS